MHRIVHIVLWLVCVLFVAAGDPAGAVATEPAAIDRVVPLDEDGAQTAPDGADEQDDDGPQDGISWGSPESFVPSTSNASSNTVGGGGVREGVVRGVFRPPEPEATERP